MNSASAFMYAEPRMFPASLMADCSYAPTALNVPSGKVPGACEIPLEAA